MGKLLSRESLAFLDQFDVNVRYHAPLSKFTTFQLGGKCKALILCQTPHQLENTIKQLYKRKLPFLLIGGGSNLVISDKGLDYYVIRYFSRTPIIKRLGNDLIVSGSTILDKLSEYSANMGLDGLICATGIPGTVGGAVVGNAGAFGQQVGDIIKQVNLIDKTGKKRKVGPKSLKFSYRHSILKETGNIVLSARFALKNGNKKILRKRRQEILNIRARKHPSLLTYPCAGSFFRNIEPTSKAEKRQAAGWFLDKAGAKKLKVGGASIFKKHANIIIKSNKKCSAQDVYELSKQMSKIIKDKFRLNLIREVRFAGKFQGKPKKNHNIIW